MSYVHAYIQDWRPVAKDTYDPLKAGSIDGTDKEPHDRGVVRAQQGKYRPNARVKGDPLTTLFVARLHPKTTEETLLKVFGKFGKVSRCRLVVDLVTGISKRYAFVEYESDRMSNRAYRDANKIEIDGCEIFVDHECERTMKGWVPRRLGGGLGGKKESGQLRFGGRDRPFRKPIVIASLANQWINDHVQADRSTQSRHQSRHHFSDN